MAQNITLMGATYSDVPAVTLPKAGGGTATFVDIEEVSKCFDVVTPSFSSLPQTFYSSDLTADCKVVGNSILLSTPDAASDDWNVTFAAGSLTISGTYNGITATTAKMSIWIPTKTITLSSTA